MDETFNIHQHQYRIIVDEEALDDELDSTRNKYSGKLDTRDNRRRMYNSVQTIVENAVEIEPVYDINDI